MTATRRVPTGRPRRARDGQGSGSATRRRLDALLPSAGNRARHLFDVAAVILVALDADGSIAMINATGCRLLGASDTDLIGRDWFATAIPERHRASVRAAFAALVAGNLEPLRSYDNPILTADGSEREVTWTNALLTDDDGSVIGTLSSGLDVSEQRRTAQALADSERRFQFVAESLHLLVWMVSPDWRQILYLSPAFAALYGRPSVELYADPSFWLEAIHPDDRDRVFAYYQAHHGQPTDQTYRIVRSDGGVRWLRDVSCPVLDDRGEMVKIAGFAEDVSDRVQADEARREAELSFRALVENARDAIVIVGAGGRIRYLNQRALELSGYLAGELVDGAATGLVVPPDRAAVDHHLRAHLEGRGAPFQFECQLLTRDGAAVPVEISSSVTRWHGERSALAIIRDMSGHKLQQQRLEQSLREKELLLTEVHHRVKNNLQIVSGLLELQTDAFTDPAHRQRLSDLQRRVQSMALVHEMLYRAADLSRVDAPEFLAALVNHLHDAFVTPTAQVAVALELAPLSLAVDTAIPCGLLVSELVANAFKHAFPPAWRRRRTPAALVVGLTRRDATLVLTVRDNGVGLPAAVEPSSSPSLGLQLVDSLVSQLGATLTIERSAGTTVTVSFAERRPEASAGQAGGSRE